VVRTTLVLFGAIHECGSHIPYLFITLLSDLATSSTTTILYDLMFNISS